MRNVLCEKLIAPLRLMTGDAIQFTVKDPQGNLLFEHKHTAEAEETINYTMAFEFWNEFGMEHGYGLICGRK